jgi:hypothetical protein
MVEFISRAGGPKILVDKNILEMQMKCNSGEVTLDVTDEQYTKLRGR